MPGDREGIGLSHLEGQALEALGPLDGGDFALVAGDVPEGDGAEEFAERLLAAERLDLTRQRVIGDVGEEVVGGLVDGLGVLAEGVDIDRGAPGTTPGTASVPAWPAPRGP